MMMSFKSAMPSLNYCLLLQVARCMKKELCALLIGFFPFEWWSMAKVCSYRTHGVMWLDRSRHYGMFKPSIQPEMERWMWSFMKKKNNKNLAFWPLMTFASQKNWFGHFRWQPLWWGTRLLRLFFLGTNWKCIDRKGRSSTTSREATQNRGDSRNHAHPSRA